MLPLTIVVQQISIMPTVNTVNGSFREYMRISNSSLHEYYGTYEQFTDNDYDKPSVFVMPGNGVDMAAFLTMDNGIAFINHYKGVKNLIIDIREAWQQKNEPV